MNKLPDIWRSDIYYQLAGKASLDINHPGMKLLIKYAKDCRNILDLGCGEGSRLNILYTKNKKLTGIDVSDKGIEIANRRYPKINFVKGNLEKLPFNNQSFDLLFSAYVLEHLDNADKVIDEAVRILRKNGLIILIAPNYGAPNRCSPPFKGFRMQKLIVGFLNDLIAIFHRNQSLDWNKVEPISTEEKYDVDWDTTIEPYLRTLVQVLESKNVKMIEALSCWSEEFPNAKSHQKFFRFLAEFNIYPFKYWGPHISLVGKKI